MIGCQELFSNLDRSIHGSVRFGDIQGVSSILFMAKTGEHWVLHGIYYILVLHNSIISLDSWTRADRRWRSIGASFGFGTGKVVFSSRSATARTASMLFVLRCFSHSAPLCVEMMRHGAGISGSTISTLRH